MPSFQSKTHHLRNTQITKASTTENCLYDFDIEDFDLDLQMLLSFWASFSGMQAYPKISKRWHFIHLTWPWPNDHNTHTQMGNSLNVLWHQQYKFCLCPSSHPFEYIYLFEFFDKRNRYIYYFSRLAHANFFRFCELIWNSLITIIFHCIIDQLLAQ